MKMLERRGALTGFATFVFFTSLAPDAWRNSISWYGYGVMVLLVLGGSILFLVRAPRPLGIRFVPLPLALFLLFATASLIWSFYPGATALGLLAQYVTTIVPVAMALLLGRDELLAVLGRTLRIILGLSLVFELVVATVIRRPIFPVWVPEADRVDPPALLYWSRDVLFVDGKIQGIVGSSTLLAMISLVALIVFSIQVAGGSVSKRIGWLWVTVAALVLVITQSATVYLATVTVGVALATILLLRRSKTVQARRMTAGGIAIGLIALGVVAVLLQGQILEALGKSSTFTGRFGIWDSVIGLAQQRPIFGWGWVSFWPPWVEPFRGLAFAGGMEQLHAHNAWLDVWLQLGLIGVAIFAALVGIIAFRGWQGALVAPRTAQSLLPPLLITALVVQSLAESRLLIEGGWVLLVVLAVTTKRARHPDSRVAIPVGSDERAA